MRPIPHGGNFPVCISLILVNRSIRDSKWSGLGEEKEEEEEEILRAWADILGYVHCSIMIYQSEWTSPTQINLL